MFQINFKKRLAHTPKYTCSEVLGESDEDGDDDADVQVREFCHYVSRACAMGAWRAPRLHYVSETRAVNAERLKGGCECPSSVELPKSKTSL